MNRLKPPPVDVRPMSPEDLLDVVDLYATAGAHAPWDMATILAQLDRFPHGQLVAEHRGTGEILGTAASLILPESASSATGPWCDPCSAGDFTAHDPNHGTILWGATLVTLPAADWQDTACALDDARRAMADRLGLRAVRMPLRLSGSGGSALSVPIERFAKWVSAGKVAEPLLRLLLKRGYTLTATLIDAGIISGNVTQEAHVAMIEWQNPQGQTPWMERHATHFLQPEFESP